jgi:hypothetical protein
MLRNGSHNSLIITPPRKCAGERREAFRFVFLCSPLGGTPFATLRDAIESHRLSSCASLCRKLAAG